MERDYVEEVWSQGIRVQIQKGDSQEIDLRAYAAKGYDSDILKQIRCAKAAGIELDPFVEAGYDGEQLREIRVAIQQGVDLLPYLKEGFCGAQLRQIRKGLRHFVEVGLYADVKYNWLQMKELRIGLQNRVDAGVYANPFYSYSQMREIRLGLVDGLDVSKYSSLMYSYTDMKNMRRQLIEELYYSAQKRKEMVVTDDVTGISIYLSEDRLEAHVTLPDDQWKFKFTVNYVEQLLKRNGIVYGIDRDNIEKAIEEKRFGESILVARGDEPGAGEDGQYIFFFNTAPSRKPVESADGKLDFQNVDIFEEVMIGQRIAMYMPPKHGTAGKSVEGIEIPGMKGKELPVLEGKGFKILEDKVTYTANMSGIIEYKEGKIQIFEALIINEDVTSSYGNVRFHGCVHIYGNVGSNVEIQATGGVAVEGTVEAANIYTKGDVLIKNGMSGSGKGRIWSGGSITGRFFENAILHAERDIDAGSLMNSEAYAGGRVTTIGKRGSIIGGHTKAVYGMEVTNIGNRSQIVTEIETGASQEIMDKMQGCQDKYDKLQSELLDVKDRINRFTDETKNSVSYRLVLSEKMKIENHIEKVKKEREEIQKIFSANGLIRVQSRAYTGTILTINCMIKKLKDDYKTGSFFMEENEIVYR